MARYHLRAGRERSRLLEVGDDVVGVGVAAPRCGSWPSRRRTATARRCPRTGRAACTTTSRAGRSPPPRMTPGGPPTAPPGGRPGRAASDPSPQARAAPQSCPTTWARSMPAWSSMATTSPARKGNGVGLHLGGLVRLPVAAQVGHDHLEAGVDQGRDLVAPQPSRVGEAVQQDDGRDPSRSPRTRSRHRSTSTRMCQPPFSQGPGAHRVGHATATSSARSGPSGGASRHAAPSVSDLVEHRRAGHDLLDRLAARRRPQEGPEAVRVLAGGELQRPGSVPYAGPRAGRPRPDLGLDLRQPVAVEGERGPVPGLHHGRGGVVAGPAKRPGSSVRSARSVSRRARRGAARS